MGKLNTKYNPVQENKTTKPLVSVVMPAHNAETYIVQAIDSIFTQTYENIELIVVNDASTDSTKSILDYYATRYPEKVTVIHTKKALGRSGDPATNMAIKQAKGAFIAKMDADDIAHPERIEKQVAFLQKNLDIYLCGTQAYVIDKHGEILGKKELPTGHDAIYTSFFSYNNMIHPSIMFRNDLNGRNFYEIYFPHFNEYYTFFKLMSNGKRFANLDEPLMYYRVHGLNDTFSNIKTKFRSTLSIKKAFILAHGYKPTITQLFQTAIQTGIVFLLPEKFITLMYLFTRKVISMSELKNSLLVELGLKPMRMTKYALRMVLLFVSTIAFYIIDVMKK